MTVVNILGTGLEGLLAAHAANRAGADVCLFERQTDDAQAEHRPLVVSATIPGISLAPFSLFKNLDGRLDHFFSKALAVGNEFNFHEDNETSTEAVWSAADLEGELYSRYRDLIVPASWFAIRARHVAERRADRNEIVVSTVPLYQICQDDNCEFIFQEYWEGEFSKFSGIAPNSVVASGSLDDWWHTVSVVNGQERTWFPTDRKPDSRAVRRVEIPVTTTCECNRKVLKLGQAGRWNANAKPAEAFFKMKEALA